MMCDDWYVRKTTHGWSRVQEDVPQCEEKLALHIKRRLMRGIK